MDVKLNIKSEYLRKYLEFIFEKKEDKFEVKTTKDFGRLLFALVKKSDNPVQTEFSEDTVTFVLPKTANMQYYSDKYYLYYDKIDTFQLNKYLEVIANIDFYGFYLECKMVKQKQKDIIDAYIVSRKLFFDNDTNEKLKKREQRLEEKKLNILRNFLKIRIKILSKNVKNKAFLNINN